MKIRIAPQSIRVRVKPAELSALHASGALHQGLALGPTPEQVLHFKLLVDPAASPLTVTSEADTVLIRVSPTLITELKDTERVGATVTREIQAGRTLTIIFEKDFKCLTHRDEDVDAFPNPAAHSDT